MENIQFSDQLGPFKIIHVQEPSVNLKATFVVDIISKGPPIGGIPTQCIIINS